MTALRTGRPSAGTGGPKETRRARHPSSDAQRAPRGHGGPSGRKDGGIPGPGRGRKGSRKGSLSKPITARAAVTQYHLVDIGAYSLKSHGVDPDKDWWTTLCGLEAGPHELVLTHRGCDERLGLSDCKRCVKAALARGSLE